MRVEIDPWGRVESAEQIGESRADREHARCVLDAVKAMVLPAPEGNCYVTVLTALAASAVVGLFDATIAQNTALAVLLPIVVGQSGNTGAQALAVTSRGLALRGIRLGHAARVSARSCSRPASTA